MNKSILLGLPVIVFCVLAFFLYDNLGKDSQHLESVLIGKPLPEFSVELLQPIEGNTQTRVDQTLIKGPALINFWATWCPTCYQEHADLMRLSEQGVTLYGVNYRDDRAEAVQFLTRLGNPFKAVFFDEQADIGFEFGVTGAPETFFVDSSGVVQYRHVGVISSQNWRDSLRAIYEGMK